MLLLLTIFSQKCWVGSGEGGVTSSLTSSSLILAAVVVRFLMWPLPHPTWLVLILPPVNLMRYHPCDYVTLIARCNKVTNQLTLRPEDYTGFSGGSNLVTSTFKSRDLCWLVSRTERKKWRGEIWIMKRVSLLIWSLDGSETALNWGNWVVVGKMGRIELVFIDLWTWPRWEEGRWFNSKKS